MGRSELFSKESSAYKAAAKLRNPVAHAARLEWKSRARMARPLLVDVAMLVLAGATTQLASHLAGYPSRPSRGSSSSGRWCSRCSAARGMYSQRLRSHLLDEIRQIVSATAVATMAVITFAIIVVDDPHTSGQTVQAWILATLFLSAGRTGLFISRSRAIARGEGRRDADRGRRQGRPPGGAPPDGTSRVRPAAGRVPGQRPARHRGPRDHASRARGELGPGAHPRGERRRARDLHLLHRSARGDAEHGSPLPRAGRVGLARAAPVRGLGRARDGRAPRRPAAARDAPDRPEGMAVPRQVRARPGRRGHRDPAHLPDPADAHRRRADHLRPPDLLPPAPHRPRRPGVRHAQVPHDEGQPRVLRAQPRSLGVRDARGRRLAAGGAEAERKRERQRQRQRTRRRALRTATPTVASPRRRRPRPPTRSASRPRARTAAPRSAGSCAATRWTSSRS